GWPTLMLALAGSIFTAIRMLRGRAPAALLLLWAIVVPTAIVMLANPRVSPDHFWAIRRFVPVVLPGTIILAGVALQALPVRYARRHVRRYAWSIAVLAGVALLVAQRST